MKIVKFKKDKSNTYKVYFDDGIEIILYDDVIIKYNLLIEKEFDNNKFNEITNYNSYLDGYYKAIKYINKKMRSEIEVVKYLEKYNIDKKNIVDIIELLYKDGYLNDEIYVKAYINDQYNLSSNGPLKVKKDLIKLGYDNILYEEYLNTLDWNKKINRLIDKKIKLNHKLSNNSLKEKIVNDIIKLGFDKEDILLYLDSIYLEDDYELLVNELNKILKKYKLKYKDEELKYKVINYLYKKGFNIEDIKRCYDENIL
ncbi:MAG: RecX family transcriptional regulator [Bacilli bacterium]|nr:RecX family transcriptional regulator [Bacilli bacterium]